MPLIKKLLFLFMAPAVISFATQCYSMPDDNWQLDDTPAEMSDDEEIALGRQVDEYIRHQFYLETDPEFNAAVNNIVQKLVAVSDRNKLPFTCAILQSLSINAFSAPGGHIYLTCGLLQFAQTEDEVAGIIGHEVAHASLQHASKFYHEVMEFLSHKGEGINSATKLLLLNSHLEEFEQDADTTGVLYAQKAGFNPNGLLDFLERHLNLIMHKGLFGMFGMSGHNSSPTINSRIIHLKEYISTLERKK
ncbi:MAG: M48 family metalloprotease [Candidatus Brocadia sp.]|nr:M48 family metalloprotease [Candidatus Brocadia sp.]